MTEFIKIAYTGKTEDGDIFDTTSEEIAKKENIFDEKRNYTLFPVIVGEGAVIKGLDEALEGMKKGEEKTITIPPEKAYGPRNPEFVRIVPLKKFKEQKMTPFPGMPIEIDGRMAKVQTVAGGRVRVDFNHELAGKTLIFDVKVEEVAKSDEEKAGFLIEKNFGSTEDFTIEKAESEFNITIPEKAYHDRNLLLRKAGFCAEAFKYLETKKVSFKEIWEKSEKE